MCYWISILKKCEIILHYRTLIGRQDLYEELLSVDPREKALIIRIILTMSGEDTATLAGRAREQRKLGFLGKGQPTPITPARMVGEHCKLPQ